jgi:hypothetical protein
MIEKQSCFTYYCYFKETSHEILDDKVSVPDEFLIIQQFNNNQTKKRRKINYHVHVNKE